MSGNHPGLSNNFSRSGVKFSWSKDNLKSIKNIISKYPKGREQSAVMPLLYLAQEQNHNWISIECIETIAETLSMPKIRVTEVASFYSRVLLKQEDAATVKHDVSHLKSEFQHVRYCFDSEDSLAYEGM